MNPIKWPLHWQIFAALVLAAVLGLGPRLLGLDAAGMHDWLVPLCDFLGQLFMNALRMIIVPLIVSSVICGILGMGSDRAFGRMGGKIVIYYTVTGMVAILVGLALVNTIQPGVVSPELAERIVGQASLPDNFEDNVATRTAGDLWDIFLRMLPPNIINAATDNGQLLGLISFSLLFGFFVNRLADEQRRFQQNLWESIQAVVMSITELVIRFAPIGVFGLVLPILVRTGFEVFVPLLWFFLTVLLALALHMFVTLALLLRFVGGVNPFRHWKTMSPVLLTAFSTSSSAATLPVTMDTVEKDAGVSGRTASFTLPLGATVNMDGTALYECVVVIFIAQFYGVLHGFEIGFMTQFTVVLLALLTSIGVAGIPAASMVAITLILANVGLPIEAVGLVWVVDRVLDMCRTAVNVYSDTCGAVIIGRSEGESGIYPER